MQYQVVFVVDLEAQSDDEAGERAFAIITEQAEGDYYFAVMDEAMFETCQPQLAVAGAA